jgi:ribosomal protein S27AE
MKDNFYVVILEGTIIEGFQRQEVVKNLSVLFRRDVEVAAELLSGKPRVIKKGVDAGTAEKYREMLTRTGAACRVEPDSSYSQELAVEAATRHQVSDEVTTEETVCPRCGYKALSEDDVMLVRGDCPRCGLIVRKDAQVSGLDESEDEDEEFDRQPESIYGDRTPASWQRRALAGIHTFTLFLATYLLLVILLVLLVFPPDLIIRTIVKEFLHTLVAAYPMTLVGIAILLVSFVLPVLIRGRSWGQRLTDIQVLHTGDPELGGFYLSIGSRAAAILLISFVPGMIAVRIAQWIGHLSAPWAAPAVILGTGSLAWILSWAVPLVRSDRRGVLDLAAATIQIEEQTLPGEAFPRALLPFIAIVAVWLGLCGAFPLVASLLR